MRSSPRRCPVTPTARCLICGVLLALPCSALAMPPIVLESHSQERPKDAPFYLEYLIRTLGPYAPVSGTSLRDSIETKISRATGPLTAPVGIRSLVEEGRRQFIEGEFTRAIAQLEEVKSFLLLHTAALAMDQNLRDLLHKALLYLAHAYLRTKQGLPARQTVQEAIRSYPDRELSLARYGPELAQLYREAKQELSSKGQGSLTITTQPQECLVFLNERYVGLSPVRLKGLYPGSYRVYLQRPGAQGRVHPALVVAHEHRRLVLNFLLDRVLRSEPFSGFRFAHPQEQTAHEIPLAIQIAGALKAGEIILFEFNRYQGRRILRGRLIQVPSGRMIRAAQIFLEPRAPHPEALKGLGNWLVLGKNNAVEGVLLLEQKPQPVGLSPDGERIANRGFFSARLLRWVMLGTSVAGLGAGAPLLALHGQGTCDNAEGVRCPQNYNTLAPGIILTSVGALSACASALFFYYAAQQRTPVRSTFLFPWGAGGGGGLVGIVSF